MAKQQFGYNRRIDSRASGALGSTVLSTLLLLGAGCGPSDNSGDSTELHNSTPQALLEAVYPEGVTVETSGIITCENPELRESEGPVSLYENDEEWLDQNTALDEGNPIAGGGLSVADFNGDGVLDIFLTHWGSNELFFGSSGGGYSNVSTTHLPAIEFEREIVTAGSAAADYDGDGDLDIFVSNVDSTYPNQLYRNEGNGVFTDVSDISGIGDDIYLSLSGSWGDLNRDGYLDLFVGNHHRENKGSDNAGNNYAPADPNQLYLNNGDGTFRDVSNWLTQEQQDCYTFVGSWLHADDDPFLDLYIVNDYGDFFISNLLVNNVDGIAMADPMKSAGLNVPMEGMGVGVGDINGDLKPDLFASSWGRAFLLESNGDGGWYDSTYSRDATFWEDDDRAVGWGAEIQDLDNDGDMDMLMALGNLPSTETLIISIAGFENPELQPDALFIQDDAGKFDQVAEEWGIANPEPSRGFVTTDLNNDGFIDIAKRLIGDPAHLYMSQCSDNNWLRVQTRDTVTPNTYAIGAEVLITAGGEQKVSWVIAGGTSVLSSGPAEVHFGLGDEDFIDEMKITWPDGEVSIFKNIQAKQVLTVTRTE